MSVITKNLNWEILTKNLVTFERWDWVKDKKFQCFGGLGKKRSGRGWGGGGVGTFEGEKVDIQMHTMLAPAAS